MDRQGDRLVPRGAILVVLLGMALTLIAARAGGTDWGPPYIEKVSPGNHATDVRLRGITYAVFTEAMDRRSSEDAFALRRSDGSPVEGAFGWYGPTGMIFVPSRPLKPDTGYSAFVARTARDSSGEMMPGPLAWRFRTGTRR